jgi:hypothetical protein
MFRDEQPPGERLDLDASAMAIKLPERRMRSSEPALLSTAGTRASGNASGSEVKVRVGGAGDVRRGGDRGARDRRRERQAPEVGCMRVFSLWVGWDEVSGGCDR